MRPVLYPLVSPLLSASARFRAASLLLAVALLCPALANAGQDAYILSGVVVSEHGGAPVAKCHLTATRSGATSPQQRFQRQRSKESDSSPSADSDAGGHFTLTVPSSGNWQLYAAARGFRRQAYDRHEGFFSAIVLTPEAPTYTLIFKLEPDSSITGFVRDEAGEAVRNARVNLSAAEAPGPDLVQGPGSIRASTTTDDRGHYEFAGLAPGDYNVGVQAQPWYATSLFGRRFSNVTGPPPDPSLDVIYPETWFPGVMDQRSAEVLSLHHGESRQADFGLTPAPSTHLRINVPSQPLSQPGTRPQIIPQQVTPQVERVSSSGSLFFNTSIQVDSQGQMEVDGLSPGLYRVTMQGTNGPQTPAFIRVPGGSQHTLDLSAAIPVATINFRFDPETDASRMQIVLTDIDTGERFTSFPQGDLQRRRNAGVAGGALAAGERKLELPPARYRVTLTGDNETYLSGISTNNTPLEGRVVSVASGTTTLTLKLTRGRASLRGVVSLADKPLAGAMVMLVPASFGQPESITMLRRDQTNTDGGFEIDQVIPGNYILLAIDDGWTVNWRDLSTLRRYLVHGVPVALQPNANLKLDLEALSP